MKAILWRQNWFSLLAVTSFCCLAGLARAAEDSAMTLEQEMKAMQQALKKDPAWKPAFREVAQLRVGKSAKSGGSVHNYCLDSSGNILVCGGGSYERMVTEGQDVKMVNASEPAEVRVYAPDGKLLHTWPVPAKPQAICVASSGEIFVGGGGKVMRLSKDGQVLGSVETPVAKMPVKIGKEIEDMLKQQPNNSAEETKRMQTTLEARRSEVTGMAVTDQDVFVVCPTPDEFTYRVYRFDHQLRNAKLVVEKLRGCCGQMDLQASGDKLWIPHNARHRVECRDRDGKELSQFGKRGRVKAEQFGGCCEPKNLRVLANGDILAAESGPPTCIKRFTATGKFLGVIALVEGSQGDCVRMTVEASPDGTKFYLLDTVKDTIRVFSAKG